MLCLDCESAFANFLKTGQLKNPVASSEIFTRYLLLIFRVLELTEALMKHIIPTLALVLVVVASTYADTPYPLTTCIVSGETIKSGNKPTLITHMGQQIKFCCSACIAKFNKNPEKYIAKIQAASKQ